MNDQRENPIKEIEISVDKSYYQIDHNESGQSLFSSKTQEYIDSKKELYNSVSSFLENSYYSENDFQEVINVINIQQYEKDHEEFEHFLHLIQHITSNYCRNETFINIIKIKLNKRFQISNFLIYSKTILLMFALSL